MNKSWTFGTSASGGEVEIFYNGKVVGYIQQKYAEQFCDAGNQFQIAIYGDVKIENKGSFRRAE